MKLEHIMTYHADLKPVVEVGVGPFGSRNIFDVTGGSFEGPKLRGKILPSGGDWLLNGPDGVGRLDVRAHIYMQYFGIIIVAGVAAEKLARGEGTDYGDTYFMTQPRFETGDPRYAWLNAVVAVGEGRFGPGWVEYRVYHVVN